jgi:hypothetical protein
MWIERHKTKSKRANVQECGYVYAEVKQTFTFAHMNVDRHKSQTNIHMRINVDRHKSQTNLHM